MVDTNREKASTFRYVNAYVRPAMEGLGIPFTVIDRMKYAGVDLWGGANGNSFLPPAFTDLSGTPAKLPEFCSVEWKLRVVTRWAAEQPGWKSRGVDSWMGISHEERHRRRAPVRQWLQPTYPLLDRIPMHISALLRAVEEVGWPEPPRSSCWMCPNMSDAEWAGLPPDEWAMACDLDDHIRTIDPHAYLHKQLVPLRQVTLDPKASRGMFGGCSSGMCL
jgi:hypothetical protein